MLNAVVFDEILATDPALLYLFQVNRSIVTRTVLSLCGIVLLNYFLANVIMDHKSICGARAALWLNYGHVPLFCKYVVIATFCSTSVDRRMIH